MNHLAADELISVAHAARTLLLDLRDRLINRGISPEHMPGDIELAAYALLGDYQRAHFIEQLAPQWQWLVNQGLVHNSIQACATPALRLLAHIIEFTEGLEDIWSLLLDAADRTPPFGLVRCASHVRGQWAQPTHVHFEIASAEHVMVLPDPVFGVQPSLLSAEKGRLAGQVSYLCDTGVVRLRILDSQGNIFTHRINTLVEEARLP